MQGSAYPNATNLRPHFSRGCEPKLPAPVRGLRSPDRHSRRDVHGAAGSEIAAPWCRLARLHGGRQGARRPGGERLAAAARRGPRLHHSDAVERGAVARGGDDRRRAVSRRLLLAAGPGAAGVVREPPGRPRAARAASRRSGGGAPHVVLPRILQRPGARERRGRDLRPSHGTGGAARVLVRGGPARRGGHRARPGPPDARTPRSRRDCGPRWGSGSSAARRSRPACCPAEAGPGQPAAATTPRPCPPSRSGCAKPARWLTWRRRSRSATCRTWPSC